MATKPCGYGKCPNVIEGPEYRLKHRVFCSKGCGMSARLATGWKPPITLEGRSLGARRGGKEAGRRAHRRSLIRAVRVCERFLDDDFRDGLTAQQLARLRVLMARAYLKGYLRGTQKVDNRRRYWRKKAHRQAQREAA